MWKQIQSLFMPSFGEKKPWFLDPSDQKWAIFYYVHLTGPRNYAGYMQDHQDQSASGQIIHNISQSQISLKQPGISRSLSYILEAQVGSRGRYNLDQSYINSWHGLVFTFHLMIPPPLTLRDLKEWGPSPPKTNYENDSDVIYRLIIFKVGAM